ncbi:MAG TPA: hypothetical protein VNO79_10380 [Actinomycetota bacterium]|nr:hypothetical protein [Actinomycetota bacterium]
MTRAEVLEALARYRREARRAATAEAPLRRRLSALVALATEARAEPDPLLRAWGERAVFEEARPLLEEEPPTPGGDGWERAQRALRSHGYASCPTCRSPLADEPTLERLRARREERARELERRDHAPARATAAAEGLR